MKKIGIIGFGNMGSALYTGLEKRGFSLVVAEKNASRRDIAVRDSRAVVVSPEKLVRDSDIVIIAVKPQELEVLFEEISPHTPSKNIISIVAGKNIELFARSLKTDSVARFMPNLAAREQKSVVGISFSGGAGESFMSDCLAVAEALGTPFELPEQLMPAVTGLSGSGIAYVFAFIHALALGGVSSGIKYHDALNIALTTCEGAVSVLRASGKNPVEMISRVISPSGTTIRGIGKLEQEGFTHAVMKAVEAASIRARELEG